MVEYFSRLFAASDLPPARAPGGRAAGLVGLAPAADLTIGVACLAISVALIYLARRRSDLPLRGVYWLFAAFVALCGVTHLVGALTQFAPVDRFEAVVKLLTGAVAVATAVALIASVPKVLAFRRPGDLESEVDARTHELARANAELRQREQLLYLALGAGRMAVWDH